MGSGNGQYDEKENYQKESTNMELNAQLARERENMRKMDQHLKELEHKNNKTCDTVGQQFNYIKYLENELNNNLELRRQEAANANKYKKDFQAFEKALDGKNAENAKTKQNQLLKQLRKTTSADIIANSNRDLEELRWKKRPDHYKEFYTQYRDSIEKLQGVLIDAENEHEYMLSKNEEYEAQSTKLKEPYLIWSNMVNK